MNVLDTQLLKGGGVGCAREEGGSRTGVRGAGGVSPTFIVFIVDDKHTDYVLL